MVGIDLKQLLFVGAVKMKKIAFLMAVCVSTHISAQPAPPYGESVDRPDISYQVFADPALFGFEKFVEAELKKWNVPGITITVVKDG